MEIKTIMLGLTSAKIAQKYCWEKDLKVFTVDTRIFGMICKVKFKVCNVSIYCIKMKFCLFVYQFCYAHSSIISQWFIGMLVKICSKIVYTLVFEVQ